MKKLLLLLSVPFLSHAQTAPGDRNGYSQNTGQKYYESLDKVEKELLRPVNYEVVIY